MLKLAEMTSLPSEGTSALSHASWESQFYHCHNDEMANDFYQEVLAPFGPLVQAMRQREKKVVFVTVSHIVRTLTYFIKGIEENIAPVAAIIAKGASRRHYLEALEYYREAIKHYPIHEEITRKSFATQVDIILMSASYLQQRSIENFPNDRAYVLTETELFYVDKKKDPWKIKLEISDESLSELKRTYTPPSYEENQAPKRLSYRELQEIKEKIGHDLDTISTVVECLKILLPEGHEAVIIDDGGYFAEVVDALAYHQERLAYYQKTEAEHQETIEYHQAIVCVLERIIVTVEITKNGHYRYKKLFDDPIFREHNKVTLNSIADSELKKIEDKEVGYSILRELDAILSKVVNTAYKFETIGIFGCGIIGKSIARAMDGCYREVRLYDFNEEAAYEASFCVKSRSRVYRKEERAEFFKACHLIISATGNHALTSEDMIVHADNNTYFCCVTSREDEMHPDALTLFDAGEKTTLIVPYSYNGKQLNLILNGDAVNFMSNSVLGPGVFNILSETLIRALQFFLDDPEKKPKVDCLNESTPEEMSHILEVSEKIYGKTGEEPETFGVYSITREFIGREKELNDLKISLIKNRRGIISQSISGLGGVGKTMLAREYVTRSLKEKMYDFVIWINASTAESIYSDFISLAIKLNIATREEIKKLKPSGLVEAVYTKLTKYQRILIVFDNPEKYDVLNKAIINEEHVNFLPRVSPSQLVHWLATTRTQKFIQSKKDEVINLSGFSLEEARKYIETYSENESEEKMELLARILHCFPLALSQALAYIWMNNLSIDAYIELYRSTQESQRELLDSEPSAEDDYYKTVYTTWDISLQTLRAQSPFCETILNVCAYFDSDIIPVEIVEELARKQNVSNYQVSLVLLEQYSLVNVIKKDSLFSKIKFHAIVQDVIRLKQLEFSRSLHYLCIAMDCFKKIYPLEKTRTEQYELARDLSLHPKKFLSHLERYRNRQGVLEVMSMMYVYLMDHCTVMGYASEAKAIAQKNLEIAEALHGKDHLCYIYALSNLAKTCGELFLFDEHCQYAEEALTIFNRLGLEDDELLINLLLGVGFSYMSSCGITKFCEELDESKLSLESDKQFASLYTNLKPISMGEEAFNSQLLIGRRIVGLLEKAAQLIQKKQSTYRLITVWSNLAMISAFLSDHLGAIHYLGLASDHIKITYDPAHFVEAPAVNCDATDIATAQAIQLLAVAYQYIEKCWRLPPSEKPRQLLEFVLPIFERTLGKENPTVCLLLCMLSDIYSQMGHILKEHDLLASSLSGLMAVNHPYVPFIQARLEEIRSTKKFQDFEKDPALREQYLKVIDFTLNLTGIFESAHDDHPTVQMGLQIQREKNGGQHASTSSDFFTSEEDVNTCLERIKAMNEEAIKNFKKGKFGLAIVQLTDAVNSVSSKLKEQINIARYLAKMHIGLGAVYREVRNYQQAIDNYEKAFVIHARLDGANSEICKQLKIRSISCEEMLRGSSSGIKCCIL